MPMSNERQTGPALRCAIYTRKSSEEGLDQSFNSLDAQREACEAYVLSQRHEGWRTIPTRYDDGGFSGGSMQRPALQALMHDIEKGLIDLIVVYKVDRLTRSLSDFAKMVELFDAKKVSFVSVTQQFNTTTSMGRLTLNVLLSFAQFEREVTGERIRDKIAASKKKGMWMGGRVPLGYDAIDRQLVVNAEEAKQVRYFFMRYLELGCVSSLKAELDQQGVVSKRRVSRQGNISGERPYSRGALYELLKNQVYIGETVHRGKTYPGAHEVIIPMDLWEKVQAQLQGNLQGKRSGVRAKEPSLLLGLAYDAQGRRLTPSHTVKRGKRYRYYVSQDKGIVINRDARIRIPAQDLEAVVTQTITSFLLNAAAVLDAFANSQLQTIEKQRLIKSAQHHGERLAATTPTVQRAFLQQIMERIDIHANSVVLSLRPAALKDALLSSSGGLSRRSTSAPDFHEDHGVNKPIVLTSSVRLARCGLEMRLSVPGQTSPESFSQPSTSLIKAMARGRHWYEQLISGKKMAVTDLAAQAGVNDRYASRILRSAFLAPDIVEAILEGRQPAGWTLDHMLTRLSPDWAKQRLQFKPLL